MPGKPKHAGGRPTKYKEEYNEQARKHCLLGATDVQLGEFFGVDESTINVWKHKHPKFQESINKGKYIADEEVAEALNHRARGYSHPEDKFFLHNGKVITQRTTKHYPPDTAAAFIWLKNRAGWKDKQEHQHGVTDGMAELLKEIGGNGQAIPVKTR